MGVGVVGRKVCTGAGLPSSCSQPRLGELGPFCSQITSLTLSVSVILQCPTVWFSFSLGVRALPESQDATCLAFVFLAPDFTTRPENGLSKYLLNEPLRVVTMPRTMAGVQVD